VYDELYKFYKPLYFAFGKSGSAPAQVGEVLPSLRKIAAQARGAK
jgi:L-ribulokinase